jgi:uncharacterized protein (UPF0333 family)
MRRMRLKKDEAQVSLEMAVAIVVVLIIFLWSIRLFLWVNSRLVLRQEAYESSTNAAQINEARFKNLQLVR